MPTNKEIEAAKAHMKEVDNAQENILEAMFDDLRSVYEDSFTNEDGEIGRKKSG